MQVVAHQEQEIQVLGQLGQLGLQEFPSLAPGHVGQPADLVDVAQSAQALLEVRLQAARGVAVDQAAPLVLGLEPALEALFPAGQQLAFQAGVELGEDRWVSGQEAHVQQEEARTW